MTIKKKILLFVCFVLAFAISTEQTYALIIDAQTDTKCGINYCETSVNLSKYFTGTQITNLKALDLKTFLPPKTSLLKNISYRFDGNNIILYGTIAVGSANYWNMNLNGLAVIDPWWNTSYVSCQNISIDNTGGGALTDFQVPFNLTYDSNMMANFSDVVFVNDTCNGLSNAIVLDFYFRNIAPSSWTNGVVEVDTLPASSFRNISIYYNNPTVTQITNNNVSLACLFGDDFNRVDSNSINGGWSESGDAGDSHVTISENKLRIVADGTWDYASHTFTNQSGLGVITDYFMNVSGSADVDGRYAGDTQGFVDGSGITIGYNSGGYWAMYTASAWKKIYNMNTNTVYDIELWNYNTTHVRIYQNGTMTNASVIKQTPPQDDMSEFNYGGTSTGKISYADMVCVRKYNNPLPSLTFGAEENYSAPIPTTTTLWINNAHANITTSCYFENHNYTAWNNASIPIWIMYNGTHAADGNGSVQWYGSLIAGVWNITANTSGNATYSSSSDWLYHTITLGNPSGNVSLTFNTTPTGNNTTCVDVPIQINCSSYALEDGVYLFNSTDYVDMPYNFTPDVTGVLRFTCSWNSSDCYNAGNITRDLEVLDCSQAPENITTGNITTACCPISTFYCSDNETLVQAWNINEIYTYAYQDCFYGCDNLTYPATCNPSSYQQNLYIFIGIIAICIIGAYLIRRSR